MRVLILSLVMIAILMLSGCAPIPPNNPTSLGKLNSAPVSCNANYSSYTYYDTDINNICFCNSTDWRQIDNGTTCT